VVQVNHSASLRVVLGDGV